MVIHLKIEQDNSGQKSLLNLLRQEEHYIPAYCGGKGICGKCKVRFLKNAPQPTENENKFFAEKELEHGWRLACETKVTGETELELPLFSEDNIEVETGFKLDIQESRNSNDSNGKKTNTEILDIEQNIDNSEYIVAVDIGTTTIAASKIDKKTGKVIQTETGVNHQRMFGADVISRIEASNRGDGAQLQKLIMDDLDTLLMKLHVPKNNSKVIISGNTTMEHLLQGYSCETLGIAPYTPVDISLHDYKNMTILPGISTYVGADIVSGIIATGMNRSEKVSILVDVGTNGEMAIGNKDKILVASTAAGPAFEGGNITHGMAGVPGAISAVTLHNNRAIINTIGAKEPIGICGSGVIEIIYELLKNQLIDETGLLNEDYFDEGYPLGNEIVFTIKDIREVQMAKSAIRTGIEILIKEYGVTYDDIDKLYLAGGFGQHMNIKKAVGIGLLPEELEDKIVAVGNTSLAGAVMFATEESCQGQFVEVADSATEVSLASNRLFQDLYMGYMFF